MSVRMPSDENPTTQLEMAAMIKGLLIDHHQLLFFFIVLFLINIIEDFKNIPVNIY